VSGGVTLVLVPDREKGTTRLSLMGRRGGRRRRRWTAGEKRGQGENFQDERKEKTPVNTEEAEKGEDPNLITWYGEDDQENPWVLNSDQQGRS